eukprot:Seg3106.3 transcript_id=Seg3106.3/GoldUCD/mRNA.D3Y31 product="Follistatin-related protein 1" protein_id=Seg3106.3/GoldUCD/D3Y31
MDVFWIKYMTVLVLVTVEIAAYLKEPCNDVISVDTCWFFRKHGFCEKNPKKMKEVCSKTCGFCQSCEDAYIKEKCDSLKSLGRCLQYPKKMRHLCPATCGFCPKKCNDVYSGCKQLSTHKLCLEERENMIKYCPETCGYCKATTPCDDFFCPLGLRCQLRDNNTPYCECNIICKKHPRQGPVCAKNGRTYENICALKKEECKTLNFIPVNHYGKCKNRAVICADAKRESAAGLCIKWKEIGACTKHVSIMEAYCRKTCNLCRVPAFPARPKCLDSEFGCCWNGINVPQKGKFGEGCAPCVDLHLCRYFRNHCNSRFNHDFMKNKCPLACGYCIPAYLQRVKAREKVIVLNRRNSVQKKHLVS